MSRRHGFTLFELLTVMIIISIVSAVVVGSINRIELSTRKGETSSRLGVIAGALRQYREDWGDPPVYNPRGEDFDNDGNPDEGLGLYALVMLDYVSTYRMLHDPQSDVDLPWVDDGGTRLKVVPGDDRSMGAAYAALVNGSWTVGNPLGPREQYETYLALADPTFHTPTPASDFGEFEEYNPVDDENYASWQMGDPYSGEWKYLPVRQGEPSPSSGGPSGSSLPVDDPLGEPSLYHRQLSHRWTDEPTPSYLPAADTVVSWSNLYRTSLRGAAFGQQSWGQDIVLFADGRTATLPGPSDSVTGDWTQGRAVQRPLP